MEDCGGILVSVKSDIDVLSVKNANAKCGEKDDTTTSKSSTMMESNCGSDNDVTALKDNASDTNDSGSSTDGSKAKKSYKRNYSWKDTKEEVLVM